MHILAKLHKFWKELTDIGDSAQYALYGMDGKRL
jgi:hypothetical protein